MRHAAHVHLKSRADHRSALAELQTAVAGYYAMTGQQVGVLGDEVR